MKNFSTSLREHATNTINLKKNVNINKKKFAKMTPRYDRMLHLWKKIAKKFASDKKISESQRQSCKTKYSGSVHSICNLRFNVRNEISLYYCFIIKELGKESEGQFECLGENTEQHNTFPFQYKKQLQTLVKMIMKVLYLTK